jgi:hypothetical protein
MSDPKYTIGRITALPAGKILVDAKRAKMLCDIAAAALALDAKHGERLHGLGYEYTRLAAALRECEAEGLPNVFADPNAVEKAEW